MGERALLHKLRTLRTEERVGPLGKPSDGAVLDEWLGAGIRFAASEGRLEDVYYRALRTLFDCIVPLAGEAPTLQEGGVYLGCWLESTGTINAELLSRFLPRVSEATYRSFAAHQREDGLLPYKITEQGPAFRQIQLVTPLARSVWNHYMLHGRDRAFLARMYPAMARYDGWLAANRDTRGTGCVEAFGAYDTGHDLSPRFWHVPDAPHLGDASRCDPDSPVLPFLAPDLTANVYCQRLYLARMAEELGESGEAWRAKAQTSLDSLMRHCYDERDAFFYDRDRHDRFVRVQSDVLLRVLACEVGDRAFFDEALRRYLLNTRKFFAKYPFTSIALDDPRFDPFSSYNSWAGPSNYLSLIRAPHAFEHHGRHVELTWAMQPILSSFARAERFAQAVGPWTGEEGFTKAYSPAILCMLDFVERLCGVLPTPDGELWFTGLAPDARDHGAEVAAETAYARTVDGVAFELLNLRGGSEVYRGGEPWMAFPSGVRVITDRRGMLRGVLGMSARPAEGTLIWEGRTIPFAVQGNELLRYDDGQWRREREIGLVYPTYE
ncbi:MGH1-like glycoside hydrolase domain-containing protein [Paenibacillus sp. GCM10023250]|uniref:MGH1-like glycoside hydrolase domain-containing protein n=1 Tax=Paenibacillus sp. GCM10023250 TaxID=3252648 RepID=UPI00360AC7D6